jgi:hypothetical protein
MHLGRKIQDSAKKTTFFTWISKVGIDLRPDAKYEARIQSFPCANCRNGDSRLFDRKIGIGENKTYCK